MSMKRSFLILPLLMFACAKHPAPAPSPVPSGDCVAASVSGFTKGAAPLVTLDELARQDFSVSAWYSPEGETFDIPGGTAVKYISNYRFSYAASIWQGVSRYNSSVTPKPVYWPLDGTLTFFCFAPYGSYATLADPVTDDDIQSRLPGYLVGSPLLCVTPPLSASDQVDFLCAPPLLDQSRKDAAGSIELDFSAHRLSQIRFSFNEIGFEYPAGTVPEGDPVAVRVTSIAVNNVVGSKYYYFTEEVPYVTGGAWSGAVSPSCPEFPDAELPRASYKITGANRELKSITHYNYKQVNVPQRNDANDNHLEVQTPSGYLLLLPQVLPADAQLEITYSLVEQHGLPVTTEIVTAPLPLSSVSAWPEGKVVRYLITLDIPARGVSALTAQVYGWDDSGNTHNEELMPHD